MKHLSEAQGPMGGLIPASRWIDYIICKVKEGKFIYIYIYIYHMLFLISEFGQSHFIVYF